MKITQAAKRGTVAAVIEALAQGDGTDPSKLLQKVCQDFHTIRKHSGHIELARYLLSHGARPEIGMVCEAARGGHARLIEVLLDGGLKRDLFVAAALGDGAAVAQALAADGAAVGAVDGQGMTPLHYCCATSIWKKSNGDGFAEACAVLLDAGADVHIGGNYHGLDQVTPLFYCAWTGGHAEIAAMLVQRGAEISPAVFFAALGHFQRHGAGHYLLAEYFLQQGFDINHNDGRTALHAFAAHEDARGVEWLLTHGAQVNVLDAEGNTPLHLAAARNSGIKVVRLLVDHGAVLDAVNAGGQRPLDCAMAKGKLKSIALLQRFSEESD